MHYFSTDNNIQFEKKPAKNAWTKLVT